MNIKNNIIDQLEKEADEFSYTLNIGLKSGEVVYVDGITRGEKNGYLNFAKHSVDTMILEIDNSLWRIQAQDIESISVKKYKTESSEKYGWISNLFLSKARFSKKTYLFWIKLFILGAILSVMYSSVRSVLGGDIMSVIMDPQLLKMIISKSVSYIDKIFIIVLFIQIGISVVDLLLPTNEPYRRIKPYPEYAIDTRLSNIIVVFVFIVFYQIFAAFLGKLV